MLSILIFCVATVSAHGNDTILTDSSQNDNIKDLIDGCEDNGTVTLEEKTYHLDGGNETHIVLNKTVTVQGIENRTVIDGRNTSLMFDVDESGVEAENEGPIMVGLRDGYSFKYLGKNVTFKNITFKDIKMVTWHEMRFENCRFINSTFTSYEYSNTFKDCSFDKSTVEIVLFFGYGSNLYRDHSKIIDCDFNMSVITYKGVYTRNYIELIGGDQFRLTNNLYITKSRFCNSNISLYRSNVTVEDSIFKRSNLKGSSNSFSIKDSALENPEIEVGYTFLSFYGSDIENPKMILHGGYFSKGCELSIENSNVSNCELETTVTFGSKTGNLKIIDSHINNSTFNVTDVNVVINNSLLNTTEFELFFSGANIVNSTFFNERNITDIIKTRTYEEVYTSQDGETFTPSLQERQVKTNYSVENSYLVNSSGKFEIRAEDINMDTTHRITLINAGGVYYFNDELIVKAEDYMGNPVSGLEIYFEYLNDYTYPPPSVKTDSKGIARYTLNKIGNSSLKIYYDTDGIKYRKAIYGIDINLTVIPTVKDIKISKIDFKSNYYSTVKGKLKIKIISDEKANFKNLKYSYKVYTKGKAKTYYSTTDSNGVTTFKLPKTLAAGSHKIEIRLLNTNIKKTVTVKIFKAKTTVKAPKITAKFKKSKYFKVTVKNKVTKKAVSKIKVKIKVYTGKKYKTFTVKTNKKGIAKINTKKLKAGKHKVTVSSANSNYKISAKSTIKIRK